MPFLVVAYVLLALMVLLLGGALIHAIFNLALPGRKAAEKDFVEEVPEILYDPSTNE